MTVIASALDRRKAQHKLFHTRAGLDQAADSLEEIRRLIERLGAGQDEAWWDGPAGLACRRDVEEIDGLVSALRRMTLPELRGLG